MSNNRLRRNYAEQLKQDYLKSGFKQGFEAGYAKAKKEFERPHGEWIWKEYNPDYNCGDIVCSKCNIEFFDGVPQERLKYTMWNFCPNCGASMIKKEGDEK